MTHHSCNLSSTYSNRLTFIIDRLIDIMWCRVNTDRVSLQLEYQPPLTNNTKNIAMSHISNTSQQRRKRVEHS